VAAGQVEAPRVRVGGYHSISAAPRRAFTQRAMTNSRSDRRLM
jgi:hypothetical protein